MMQIFRSLAEISARRRQQARSSVVTVGSFDGIHRAHAALLQRVCGLAKAQSAISVAVSFDPHPLAVLAPDRMPKLLTPLPLKIELLAATGVDWLLLIPFTTEMSHWAPERFVQEVLVDALDAASVIVGENFRFGHRQAGTPDLLLQLGPQHGFGAEVFPKMTHRGRAVSSSGIRALLQSGNVSVANRLLGRPFAIRGSIESGLGIGSKQTVPTLNLGAYDGLIPGNGVYVTVARLYDQQGRLLTPDAGEPSVTNVGTRPTFGERSIGVETHLLAPPSQLPAAPAAMEIAFLFRLRDEKKFETPAALLTQIQHDILRAQRYFQRVKRLTKSPTAGR